jgi:uncharacterized protein
MLSHKKELNTSSIPPQTPDDQSASGIDPQDALIQVKAFAKACFDKASGKMIGSVENVDIDVLRVAAYLHDIGRSLQDASNGAVCHAAKGAQIAEPFVERLPLTKKQKQNIIHCIRSHRFRNHHTPGTPEAKVLFDADKLDAIGAIGVARAFLFAGEVGARLHNADVDAENAKPYSVDDTGYREFKVKLCKIKDQMLTAEGRKLASERHAFMNDFFNRFLEEYEGKR